MCIRDRFCVLLQEPEKEKFCREKFFWAMEKRRKEVPILPQVSYGSAELLEQELSLIHICPAGGGAHDSQGCGRNAKE